MNRLEKYSQSNAFPDEGNLGMDMRDYFAAAALQGIAALIEDRSAADVAKIAVDLADALLKEMLDRPVPKE